MTEVDTTTITVEGDTTITIAEGDTTIIITDEGVGTGIGDHTTIMIAIIRLVTRLGRTMADRIIISHTTTGDLPGRHEAVNL